MSFAETEALKEVRSFLQIDHHALATYGAAPPRALLLSGPPGVGKTKAVYIAAKELSITVHAVIPGPKVIEKLRQAFAPTIPHTSTINPQPPRLIFLDELDATCPAHTSAETSSAPPSHATSLLTSFLDPPPVQDVWRSPRPQVVFVIAATNRPNAIDRSLRRPGRFDLEIALSPPAPHARLSVLSALEPNADPAILAWIADRAAGFVPADLAALCKHARQAAEGDAKCEEAPTPERLRAAFRATTPSVLRDSIAVEVPECSWEEIGGLAEVKKRLRMAVEWPLRYPKTFYRLGLQAPRGILLHGPPGCCKTTLVRAAASQSRAAFVRLSGADIYSCFLGEAERILRQGFASARAAAPCILFLDEIDAVVGKRGVDGSGGTDGNGVQERVLSTLLTEMDGVVSAEGVLVVGATNRVDLLDDALLRPGRFDDILEVGLPDEEARLHILQIHSRKLPLAADIDLNDIAKRSIGRSGADLKALCMEAGLVALRERYADLYVCNPNEDSVSHGLQVSARHFVI